MQKANNPSKKELKNSALKQTEKIKILTQKAAEKEKQRLYSLFKQAPVAIAILKGPHHVYEFSNPLTNKVLKVKNPIGKSIKELFPDNKEIIKQLDVVYKTGKPFNVSEYPINLKQKNKKPHTIYVNATYQPLRDSKQKIIGILTTGFDVTGQVMAREESEKQKQIYETIASNTPDLIYVFDLNYRFTYANEALLQMWGKKTLSEALGKGLRELGYEDWHAKMHENEIDQIVKTKKPIRGVVSFPHATLGKRVYDYIFTPVLNSKGKVEAVVGTTRDITELMHANDAKERLAAVVESSDDAIISQSADGIIETWNKGAQKLYGYSADEIVGKPVSTLMPPEKKDDFPLILKQLKQGKRIEHYETKRMTKDGRIVDVSITISPIKNSGGKIIGASKVARDITDRKRHEEQQRFLQRAGTILGTSIEYETTLKNLAKIIVPYLADYCRIVVIDETNNIKEITVNHVDVKKLPIVRELYDLYKDDPKNTAGVGRILKTGRSEIMSKITPEILKDANPKVIRIINNLHLQSYMGTPMKIGKRTIGVLTFSSIRKDRIYTKKDLVLAEELARRAALAIENARLYTESQKAVALRDEFISVASHELKTPVTSLKLYVQVLKKQAENKGEDSQHLERMDTQINKLTLLIEDLLNVSRFQSGKLEYHDEKFDLHKVVDEVVEVIQPITKKHNIEIDGELDRKVWGDKDRISQVLSNLLTNAIKYSPYADKIIVKLEQNDKCAVVSVQDFGIGIDNKHIPKLFERFYRVNDRKEKTFPGLGIGLYISNEIIKRYGGEMNVESAKGKGSKFSFTIPCEPVKVNYSLT